MFSCSVLVSPSRDLKNHVRQDSMPERVDAKSKNRAPRLRYFQLYSYAAFLDPEPFPHPEPVSEQTRTYWGPAATFRSGSSTARVRVWLAMKCFICVSVCRRVMKPVGYDTFSSTPFSIFNGRIGTSLSFAGRRRRASPVQSAASRLEWRGK